MPATRPSWGRGMTWDVDELAHPLGGLGPGVDRGADAAHVAADDGGDEAAADLDRARTSRTLAALHMASLASTRPTRPFVSTRPSACLAHRLLPPCSAVSAALRRALARHVERPRSSWGRGITCTLTTSPTRRGGRRAGVGRGLARGHVALHEGGHQARADRLPAREGDARRLQHGVDRLEQGDQPAWSRSFPAPASSLALFLSLKPQASDLRPRSGGRTRSPRPCPCGPRAGTSGPRARGPARRSTPASPPTRSFITSPVPTP